MKRTSALLTLISPAAPNPCATRAIVNSVSECDSAQASDATVNSATPIR